MALEGLAISETRCRLVIVDVSAENIPPFNQFAIPEIALAAAAVGSSPLDAAAPVEPAAAIPAGSSVVSLKGRRTFPAVSTGPCAPLVLELLRLR
jgi:hypothetical protein